MFPVTRDVAIYHCGIFYHTVHKNADGSPLRCRANGVCKTWKTRPQDWRLPVKHGLRTCFYLTPANTAEWQITDEDSARVRRCLLCVRLKVSTMAPDGILRDLAREGGAATDAEILEILGVER